MIIYQDVTSGDELLSDTFKIMPNGALWEVDCAMITKGPENFILEGANPSAEGEDADDGGAEGGSERVLDIVDQFRLQSVPAPTKKMYQAHLKKYFKKLTDAMKEKGRTEDDIKAWQTEAAAAAKKILGNFDKYDFYIGESLEEDSMFVLVDYREDGITPYATIWKDGLKEYKV